MRSHIRQKSGSVLNTTVIIVFSTEIKVEVNFKTKEIVDGADLSRELFQSHLTGSPGPIFT
jgi:hypothetical protein